MPDSRNDKLDQIISMLGQMQRALGHVEAHVQAIRQELAAKGQEKKLPEPPQVQRNKQ